MTEALSQTEIQNILTRRLDSELPEPLEAVLDREEQERVLVRGLLEATDDEGQVPAEVIENLEINTRLEIYSLMDGLPVNLSPIQRAHLVEEITQRLARRLRQGT